MFKTMMIVAAASVLSTVALAHDHHHHNHGSSSWTCATVYQGTHFSGNAMEIKDGARIKNLGRYNMSYGDSWNNRISSVVVEKGCTLRTFQYNNFGRHYYTGQKIGARQDFFGPGAYPHMGYTDNLVSSLTCSCQ